MEKRAGWARERLATVALCKRMAAGSGSTVWGGLSALLAFALVMVVIFLVRALRANTLLRNAIAAAQGQLDPEAADRGVDKPAGQHPPGDLMAHPFSPSQGESVAGGKRRGVRFFLRPVRSPLRPLSSFLLPLTQPITDAADRLGPDAKCVNAGQRRGGGGLYSIERVWLGVEHHAFASAVAVAATQRFIISGRVRARGARHPLSAQLRKDTQHVGSGYGQPQALSAPLPIPCRRGLGCGGDSRLQHVTAAPPPW